MGDFVGNSMRNMTDFSYGDERMNKSTELNASMSIDANKAPDELEKANRNAMTQTKGSDE